jgi:hypothetical protein
MELIESLSNNLKFALDRRMDHRIFAVFADILAVDESENIFRCVVRIPEARADHDA